MRTNIEIDDELMEQALATGPFKTKKDAVEAGLKLILRQAAAHELLKLEGKLNWGWGDEERLDGKPNWSVVLAPAAKAQASKSVASAKRKPAKAAKAVGVRR